VSVASSSTATIQESHLVALHLLCDAFDREIVSLTTTELRAVNR
jgi:hypothetical protein